LSKDIGKKIVKKSNSSKKYFRH